MDKMEHLALMLNKRTNGKDYENFVINSIYAKIANPNLIPITQQYVKNKNSYYLLDLYFPQINYGIEVDENQHNNPGNKKSDEKRAEYILTAIQCKEGRIAIFNADGTPKTYEEIEEKINEQVEIIKDLIKEKEKEQGKTLYWKSNDEKKNKVIKDGKFSSTDDVDYKGITEIYNIVGHNVKNLGRSFVELNSSYKLWVPHLAIKLDDGRVITKNGWTNTLNENKTIIYEVVGDLEEYDTKDRPDGPWDENGFERVVFMHIKDSFGIDKVKFLGVYKADRIETNNGKQTRIYKRGSEEIQIDNLRPKK